MKNSLLSLLLVLTNLVLSASETVIKGTSKSFTNKELVVFGYSDYVTNTKKKIGYAKIKNDGKFSFNFEIKDIKKVEIKIEDKTTWFFIKPGEIYNIQLDFDPILNKQRVYDKILSLKFNFPAPTELNQLIAKFNGQYDDFIDENYSLFMKRDRSIEPKIEEFKTKALNEFKKYNVEFIIDYITYTVAGMFNSIDVSYNVYQEGKNSHNTKADIYLNYLDKKKVLYNNPEYGNFFKDFFKGEFKRLSLEVRGVEISTSINENASYSGLSKALNKYPFLKDDEFKNLFLLNGLYEISTDKYFKKDNLITILKEIEATSLHKDQKIIATNIIKSITKEKIEPGVNAPQFTLKNKEGKMISLSNFEGKHVYMNFWVEWSVPSITEMKIMNRLYKKYKGKIAFVSICMDNDFEKMTRFLEKNPDYNWEFLHIGENKKLQEQYNVRTLPTYILIDNQQKILKAPAGRPGGTAERATAENIDREFYNIINKR